MTLIFSSSGTAPSSTPSRPAWSRPRNGHDLAKIHALASFFVSRVDAEIDKRLDGIGTLQVLSLKGMAGIANARLAYQVYEELFATERWALLAEAGALPQRPL
ncbi:transaldolase family protein [Arthrobacter sp. NPDC056691]|uniref:transaldolase family protein n=1 Tax=Arthrobacter sp. NPDC056691 TaxID=3345913 RepID=UPI0036733AF6